MSPIFPTHILRGPGDCNRSLCLPGEQGLTSVVGQQAQGYQPFGLEAPYGGFPKLGVPFWGSP